MTGKNGQSNKDATAEVVAALKAANFAALFKFNFNKWIVAHGIDNQIVTINITGTITGGGGQPGQNGGGGQQTIKTCISVKMNKLKTPNDLQAQITAANNKNNGYTGSTVADKMALAARKALVQTVNSMAGKTLIELSDVKLGRSKLGSATEIRLCLAFLFCNDFLLYS